MLRRRTEIMMAAVPSLSTSRWLASALCVALVGCGHDVSPTNVEVRLSSALGCRPSHIDSTRIEGWGDFPLSNEHIVVSVDRAQVSLEGLPRTTSALFIEVLGGPFVGRGVAEIPSGVFAQRVLVLPSDVSCPLPDPEVRLVDGAALAMLDGGALLFVGGLDASGAALRRVLLLAPGEELGDSDLAPLSNRVAYASATPIGPREVLVAGGAAERDGGGSDTFERLALDDPPGAPRRVGTLAVGRRDHAALALADGSVLLVGGRSRAGMLDTIERIEATSAAGALVPARLRHARVSATLVQRVDGSVVIAGGSEESGPSATIEILSADGLAIEEVTLGLPAPASVSVLPGPRLSWIGVDGSVHHVLLEGTPIAVDAGFSLPVGSAAVSDAGEALVRDARRAELVLVRRDGSMRRVPSSRGIGALVAVSDGTFVELDRAGASRFRPSVLSRHAAPPNSYQFPLDRAAVLVDSPSRFSEGTLPGGLQALVSVEGGSLDIPELEFADVLITLRMGRAGALRFTSSLGPSGIRGAIVEVPIEPDAVRLEGCVVPRDATASIAITRRGDQLTIDAGLGAVVCSLNLPERVGIGVRLDPGEGISSISLARLLVP